MIPFHRQSGFTLVEMIVSLAVFSTVVTISVGALLVLISSNEQLQNEQSVMTNLSFALDSMTREMRTGTYYYCDSAVNYSAGGPSNIFNSSNNQDSILGTSTQDCTGRPSNSTGNIHGVSFIEAGDSISGAADRILYFHERGTGQIFRRVGTGPAQSIVSSGIFISDIEFYVTGSEPLSENSSALDQPAVTIYIEARDVNEPDARQYRIQTTVSQRTIDI
jgi:prepilin-type N-terminal cleavage/methylation domain-containing protein